MTPTAEKERRTAQGKQENYAEDRGDASGARRRNGFCDAEQFSGGTRRFRTHQKRILAAAQELNYRPDFFARTLRMRRTFTIGVIAEEIGDAYGSQVISGSRNT